MSVEYFVLRSRLNGHVLAVDKESMESSLIFPGAPLVTARYQSNDPTQEWAYHADTHTLRPRADERLCVDVVDKQAVVNPFQEGNTLQQWGVAADRVHQRNQVDVVLEISNKKKQPGAIIKCDEWNEGKNQIWCQEKKGIQYFYLRCKMHGKVVDVKGADEDAGTKAILYVQNDDTVVPNQLWYQDKEGIIHSKLTHMVFDFSDGKSMKMQPFDRNNPHQGFRFIDGIVARSKDFSEGVLDVVKRKTGNGAELNLSEFSGEPNQLWWRNYVN